MTEDEMVGWHHRHNGHGFGWTPGVGDGQGSLACCDSWGSLLLQLLPLTQPVHPKGGRSQAFIGGTDVEAETPILWPPHAES